MKTIVWQQLSFSVLVRNGRKAGEADGVEGTIPIPSVRVKDNRFINHHIRLSYGEDFNLQHCSAEIWSIWLTRVEMG